jgi:hypothetical protein
MAKRRGCGGSGSRGGPAATGTVATTALAPRHPPPRAKVLVPSSQSRSPLGLSDGNFARPRWGIHQGESGSGTGWRLGWTLGGLASWATPSGAPWQARSSVTAHTNSTAWSPPSSAEAERSAAAGPAWTLEASPAQCSPRHPPIHPRRTHRLDHRLRRQSHHFLACPVARRKVDIWHETRAVGAGEQHGRCLQGEGTAKHVLGR